MYASVVRSAGENLFLIFQIPIYIICATITYIFAQISNKYLETSVETVSYVICHMSYYLTCLMSHVVLWVGDLQWLR